ncbi:MAG: holo-ACP synthase [Treponema sp.]|jgi:holo-[acyl-carrier protein] synthase|nr:holo-ACP synthase [Treponema sp.]
MIYGLGIDLAEVRRFEKWVRNPDMIKRFFNEVEYTDFIRDYGSADTVRFRAACRHFAVRFAAKEAFSKALGTGLAGIDLPDIWIYNDHTGKPVLRVQGKTAELLDRTCGPCHIHVSLTHEKETAAAVVVIEI